MVWRTRNVRGERRQSLFTLPFEWSEFVHQLDAAGSKSLPLVALAGAATGVVLALQSRASLVRFGAKSMLPTMLVFSVVKEMGPIITGLVASGRIGAGIGAELGSMTVTEQIEAMEASAVNPYIRIVLKFGTGPDQAMLSEQS